MRVVSESPGAPAPGQSSTGTGPARAVPSALRRYGDHALAAATAAAVLLAVFMAFLYAPTDANQGDVQRIEYFHVAIAWIAYLAFFVVGLAGAMYLWRRDDRWDWAARASAEVGIVFTTLVLITGSLWGKAYWGTWWQWDARLTTTLVLWFIYVGYLLLRSYSGRTEGGARNAAVLGIVGFIVVPINYLSIYWWRTLHPDPQLPIGKPAQAPASVVVTLLVAVLAFTLLYALLMVQVYRLQRLQTTVERLRTRVEFDD